ncbi:uncharacterized protein BO80DRAFT_492317 [Aspergillus ibericus CBS 121593]|uniref:Actin-like ATPase domain-containing protein n=1 Tax=Aspergillus ibericus CBS 121593 TaxID=1448316 RepID=A0A395H6U6_9EURO|nr:hypothetical protein BO80DRAFT_492317 [Aspergillus ibericus CBS 121593]RAL02598.1 hypothetical protein BO80DRAFT_492317 [Aspergillus ibericus CBS 121593]
MSRKRKTPPEFTESPSPPFTHRIIVGVDYGTTYTGVGYASTKDSGISDVIMISTWPGPTRDSETVFKTPSRIAYDAENPRVRGQRWGYQVEPGMTAYSWTKLFLDKNTPLTEYDDAALNKASGVGMLMLPEGRTAVDVVADYLAEIYKHLIKTIAKTISEEALSATPIEFWFTVPAIWSDEAQAATREAAERASIVDRPSQPGDDDITTYLVNEIEPVLEFEELCTGTGGKCGSIAIDREFYRLMPKRFGDAFDLLPMKRKGPGSDFMKKFEIIKRDFGYSDDNTLFRTSPQYEVTDQILSLVRQQITDAQTETGSQIITRIILVGGFGDSEYLRKAFRDTFELQEKIMITVPDNPQAAIVQGAVLRGLEVTRFEPSIDNESVSFHHFFTGEKSVNIMRWIIAKGDKYSEAHTCTVDMVCYPEDGQSRMTLYSCDLPHAPERFNSQDERGKISHQAACRLQYEITCRDEIVGQAIIDFRSHEAQ